MNFLLTNIENWRDFFHKYFKIIQFIPVENELKVL